jgi:hypothetical protein
MNGQLPIVASIARSTIFTVALLSAEIQRARGHVVFDFPNAGDLLTGGSNYTIQWHPDVAPHDTLNFDVWYSTVGMGGPWTTIVADVPPGNLAVGSIHTYSWTVPNITDSSVWLRIVQENDIDVDYEDINGSFSIAAAQLAGDYNGDQIVNAADFTVWRDSLGRMGTDLAADGNNNDRIDAGDYDLWKSQFGLGGSGAVAASLLGEAVPEPSAVPLWLLSLASPMFCRSIRSLQRGVFAQ